MSKVKRNSEFCCVINKECSYHTKKGCELYDKYEGHPFGPAACEEEEIQEAKRQTWMYRK